MRAGGRKRPALSRSPGRCGLPAGSPELPSAQRGVPAAAARSAAPGAGGRWVRAPRPPHGGAVSTWTAPERAALCPRCDNSPGNVSGKPNRCYRRAGTGSCAMLRAGGRCSSLPGRRRARRHRSGGLRRMKSAVSPVVSFPLPLSISLLPQLPRRSLQRT